MRNDRRPEPPVPAGCDLRDFPFMPLLVGRLRRGKTWIAARARPELGFYLVNLWTASWHEVPAASLRDDDEVLAELAMCEPRRWPRLREQVLRGWVLCRDGRLYHRVVAEVALEAWQRKCARRARTEAARAAKAAKKAGAVSVTEDVTELSQGRDSDATGSKGQRQGQGQGDQREDSPLPSLTLGSPPAVPGMAARALPSLTDPPGFSGWYLAYPRHVGVDRARRAYAAALKRGATPAGLLRAVEQQIAAGVFDVAGRFRPAPASWLEAGRWRDEAESEDAAVLRAVGLEPAAAGEAAAGGGEAGGEQRTIPLLRAVR